MESRAPLCGALGIYYKHMEPVSFEEHGYVSTSVRPKKEGFSIAGILTRHGVPATTAQVVLAIVAIVIIVLAGWLYYANTPRHVSEEKLRSLPDPTTQAHIPPYTTRKP